MQLTAKLKNKAIVWSSLLKPHVMSIVKDNGVYYANITGYNAVLTDTSVWFPLGGTGGSFQQIDKTASDITGIDPFFSIDLSSNGLPAYPKSMALYIDLQGDGSNVEYISPIQYNAATKILSGMNSPTDFPAQLIKIFVS